jgi:y4mF family transcriptional regulator
MTISSSETLAATIRARRKELGLTQQDLADLSTVSARTIFELESGNSAITFQRLLLVLTALGLSIDLAVNTSVN